VSITDFFSCSFGFTSYPYSLPSYEASHEFDKRGRRNQPPPGIMPPDGYFRPNPLPNQPPPFFGRGQHRPGPPPPVIMSALMQHQAGGQNPGGQHPPGQQYPGGHPGSQHPPFGRPPPYGASRGMQHPQRQPPRAIDRPAHLPPRPMAPMGAPDGPHGGRGPRRGGGRHAGGGGGDGPGGGGALPYS
jgi:serine/threonine-protein kinase BUR1